MAKVNKAVDLGYTILGVAHCTAFLAILNKTSYEYVAIIEQLVCWDSSVRIATRNGLDGLGIKSRWGRDFSEQPRPALGPTQPPIQ